MPRAALRVIQLGAIAVVLAVTTLNVFELDRFFVPKELVLHATAIVAALLVIRRIQATRLLSLFLLVSAVSAVFATNPWLAMRAIAITASGILLFWTARAIRESGEADRLLDGLALAVVIAAVVSLMQAYGLESLFFSDSRAPGGTLGNRNFVAHVAAFGLPLLLRTKRFWFGAIGTAIVTATLVLTRSRAAWLAFGAVLVVFVGALLLSRATRGDWRTWRRLGGIVILAGAGVAAALVLPNALRWRSRNPYLETLERVADYHEGSGRGRLVQYERSLAMAAHHPLLGVGPGNWSVEYPAHAPRNDPSMNDSEAGMTFNPWPSSDWIAFVAERGFAAAILLAVVFAGMAIGAFRQLNAGDSDGAALLAMIVGANVVALFDAAFLLAVPAMLVWPALGALSPPAVEARRAHRVLVFLVIVVAAAGVARSAAQLIAMHTYATSGDRASLVRAAQIDPGNYRLRLRLARIGPRKQRCEHARAAHALFPSADAARAVSRGCD